MRGLFASVLAITAVGVMGAIWWVATDYTTAKAENRAHVAAKEINNAVLMTFGMQVQASRARDAHFRNLHEELRNVQDDNSCSSPAIDFAYEQLRQTLSKR